MSLAASGVDGRVPASGTASTWVRRHPLASYFLLAYALSWLVSAPHILFVWGIVPADFLAGFMLKQWVGPALAGMIVAAILGGRDGLRRLRASGRMWRVGWPWYAVALVGPPLLILLSVLGIPGVGLPGSVPREIMVSYPVNFALVFIAVGFPEELGWRGFALPRLQRRFGPLAGTLVLGMLWAAWHLPFFLTPDHGGGPDADLRGTAVTFALFTGMVVAMSVVFSYVFNRTGGSVLLAALLHTAIDAPQLVWLPLLLPVGTENSASGERHVDLALMISFGLLAVLLVALTRGRLGWSATDAPPDERETTGRRPARFHHDWPST